MTVSPSAILIGWSRAAIRDSADIGSPCDPVQTRTTSPGGMPSASRGSTSSPPRTDGTLQVAEVARDTHVPHHGAAHEGHPAAVRGGRVQHLLHPVHVAGEAGHDDPLLGLREHLVQHRGDVTLAGDDARDLGVGGVGHAAGRRPRPPRRAKPPRSVSRPSSGSWSILKSPVCRTTPAGVVTATASASGMEWLTAKNSRPNGPNDCVAALRDLGGDRRNPVLGELAADQGERQARADQRDVVPLAQQVGHTADVVLVRMGEDHRLDVIQPAFQRAEVRQDQVHAGLVRLGEQHPAVHDEQAAVVLQHGHVPADLAQAAKAHDAQRAGREGGRCAQLRVRVTHLIFTPPATRSARSCSISAGVASISGPRTGPPGSPSRLSAALVVITPWVRVMMPV